MYLYILLLDKSSGYDKMLVKSFEVRLKLHVLKTNSQKSSVLLGWCGCSRFPWRPPPLLPRPPARSGLSVAVSVRALGGDVVLAPADLPRRDPDVAHVLEHASRWHAPLL